MAKLTVIKPKPVKQPPATYTLTLTKREAQVLHFLTGQISGIGPDRTIADGIWLVLDNDSIKSGDVKLKVTY